MSGDVRDLAEEVELSFVEAERWAGQRLSDLLNDILQLIANLIWRSKVRDKSLNNSPRKITKRPAGLNQP